MLCLNRGLTMGEKEFKGTNALLFPRLGDYAVIRKSDGAVVLAGHSSMSNGVWLEVKNPSLAREFIGVEDAARNLLPADKPETELLQDVFRRIVSLLDVCADRLEPKTSRTQLR